MKSLFAQAASSATARAVLGLPRENGNNVTISAFLDEGGLDIQLQAQVAAGLGLTSFAGRSAMRQGKGVHFEDFTAAQLNALLTQIYEETGVQMDEFGTRLGKVELLPDGNLNVRGKVMTRRDYFDYVRKVIGLAQSVMTSGTCRRRDSLPLAVRMFDCYPGGGRSVEACFDEAADVTGITLELCTEAGLLAGVEVEARLTGQNAANMLRMRAKLGEVYRVVLDLGNLDSLGFDDSGAIEQAEQLLDVVAPWMHLKAFLGRPGCKPGDAIDEEAINKFGPVHLDQAHMGFLPKFAARLPSLLGSLSLKPGQFRVTLEPHFLKGGQFGGYSWVAGLGAALRSAQYALSEAGLGFALTQYEDLRPDNEALVMSC